MIKGIAEALRILLKILTKSNDFIFVSKQVGIPSSFPVFCFATSIAIPLRDIHQPNDLFAINPNPASEFIKIKFSSSEISTAVDQIQIYNSVGQEVMVVSDFVEILQRIDIAGLPPGIYTLGFQLGRFGCAQ